MKGVFKPLLLVCAVLFSCVFIVFTACSDNDNNVLESNVTPHDVETATSLDIESSDSLTTESTIDNSTSSDVQSSSEEVLSEDSIGLDATSSDTSSSDIGSSVSDDWNITGGDEEESSEHTHVYSYTTIIEPTCEEDGRKEGVCQICKTAYDVRIIPKLGHDISYTAGKEPTCAEEGYTETIKCMRCKKVLQPRLTLPKTEQHTIVDNACTICDYSEICYELTVSNYYTCIGTILENPTELVIADTYMGLPVRRIEANAFENWYSLTKITLGENIDVIEYRAFFCCYNLFEICNKSDKISLTMGATDHGNIAEYAAHIYSDPSETKITKDADGFITYTDENGKTFLGYCGNKIDLTLPEGITKLNAYSFVTSGIVEVTLPNTLKIIGAYAFCACTTIERVNINAELERIDIAAFYGLEKNKDFRINFANPSGWQRVDFQGNIVEDVSSKFANETTATECLTENNFDIFCRDS